MDECKICTGTKNIKGCGKNLEIKDFYVNLKTGQIKNLCKNCTNNNNKNNRKNSKNIKSNTHNDQISEITEDNEDKTNLLKEQISKLEDEKKNFLNLINKLTNANEELIFINKTLSEKILIDNNISSKIDQIKDEISAASSKKFTKVPPDISKKNNIKNESSFVNK